MLKRSRLKISSGFTLTNVEQQPLAWRAFRLHVPQSLLCKTRESTRIHVTWTCVVEMSILNVSADSTNLKRQHFTLANGRLACVAAHTGLILYSQCIDIIIVCMKVKFTCRGKEKGNRSPSRASGWGLSVLQRHDVKKKRKKHEYGAGWFWKQTRCQHHFSEHNVLKVFD